MVVLKLHRIIDMQSKYNNMHNNNKMYILICSNNYVIISINYMLSTCKRETIDVLAHPRMPRRATLDVFVL